MTFSLKAAIAKATAFSTRHAPRRPVRFDDERSALPARTLRDI